MQSEENMKRGQLLLIALIIGFTFTFFSGAASAEDLSDEELEELHQELSEQAEQALGTLEERRSNLTKKAS